MELRHLRYFVAVAEEENITRAAARLHVSQPPLSRQIRDLEDELELKLLERTPKAVQLTEAGRVFLREARAVLDRAAEAVKIVKATARSEAGEIQMAYAPSPTAEILPRALHSFSNIAPDVQVHLHDCSSGEMIEGLRKGHLDIALLVQPCAKSLRGLRFHPLIQYPFRVAMRPHHPWTRLPIIPVEKLVHEPLIAYSRAHYGEYHLMLESLCKPYRTQPRIVAECDSVTSMIAAVESGRGVALLPEVVRCLAGNRIRLKPLTPEPPPVVVGWATLAKPLKRHAQKMVQTLNQLSLPTPAPISTETSKTSER